MDREPAFNPQSVWKSQSVESRRLSAEAIQAEASRFQRKLRARNLREYVAAVVVIAVFGTDAWLASSWLAKAGPALIGLGALYIMVQLYTRGSALPVPPVDAADAQACVRFYLGELERQRDLLRSVWRWYLGPLVPGLLLVFSDRFVNAWTEGQGALLGAVGSALVAALVFIGVGWLNVSRASKFQRQIDALRAQAS